MMPVSKTTKYDIPLSQFLPAYSIQQGFFSGREPETELDWQATWFQKKLGKTVFENEEVVKSKSCEEVIDGLSDLTSEEKQIMKDELPAASGFMCPDVKSLTVQGGVIKDEYRFELSITLDGPKNPSGVPEEAFDTGFVISILTRYFDAENYTEKGYQDFISVDNDVIYPLKDQNIVMRKQIAQSEIDFFNNKWWSAKDFSLMEF